MDPNANLKEQLELAESIADHDCADESACPQCISAGLRLSVLVIALDDWLRVLDGGKSGFLPERWQITDGPGKAAVMRDVLAALRDECLGSKEPGYMDPEGAVILSHAIRWLSFKVEGKPYAPPTD